MIKALDLQKITQQHKEEYVAAIERVVSSGWFLQGEETSRFEKDYAQFVGTQHCIGVGNGLDALTIMLRAYKELGRLSDGDEVIVPANTYIATVLAITENNLKPIFAEPTWEGLTIDITRIEKLITQRTKALMTVHLYGRLAYSKDMREICNRYGLLLLEDCAQAHGCKYDNRVVGALGNAAAHSFYPGKNLGAFGDAGAITTDDGELAEAIRAIANYGSQRKYVFKYKGVNSRISEIDAAVLSVKLSHLQEDNAHRQHIAAYYYSSISNPQITLPVRLPDSENVYHQFPVFCQHRDELQQWLSEHGIQTVIHYPIPPHKQECYAEWHSLSLPITERIHAQELSLPISPVITEIEAAKIVNTVNEFRI